MMDFANLSNNAGFSPSRRTSTSSCSTIYKPSHVYRTLSAFYNPSPLESRPVAQRKAKPKSPKRADSATSRRLLGRSTRLANKSASSLFSKFFLRPHGCTPAEPAPTAPVTATPAPKLNTTNLSIGGPVSAPPAPTGHNSVLHLDEYHQQQRELCGSLPLPELATPEPELIELPADSPVDGESRTRSTSNSSSLPWSPAETDVTELSIVESASTAPEPVNSIDEAWDTALTPKPTENSNKAEAPPHTTQPRATTAPSPPPTIPLPAPPPLRIEQKLAPKIHHPKPRDAAAPAFGTFTTCAAVPLPTIPPRAASVAAATTTSSLPSSRTATPPPRLLTPQPRRKTLRLFPQPAPPADLPILPYKRLSLAPDHSSAKPHLRPQTASRRTGSVSSGPSVASDASRSSSVASAASSTSSNSASGTRRGSRATVGSGSAASEAGVPLPASGGVATAVAENDQSGKLREWELSTYALRYEDTARCGEPFRTKVAAQLRSGKRW